MPIQLTKPRKNRLINLLPQDEFESTTFGRVMKWALSTFRIMVIITELVVMSAFLSRFWLDARNSDLNDEVSNNKSQIIAYRDIETEFRSIQERIDTLKVYFSNPKISEKVIDITKVMPQDITLKSIADSDGVILIKASSFNESSIGQFIINLNANKKFSEVALVQVTTSNDDALGISFTISAKGGNK